MCYMGATVCSNMEKKTTLIHRDGETTKSRFHSISEVSSQDYTIAS